MTIWRFDDLTIWQFDDLTIWRFDYLTIWRFDDHMTIGHCKKRNDRRYKSANFANDKVTIAPCGLSNGGKYFTFPRSLAPLKLYIFNFNILPFARYQCVWCTFGWIFVDACTTSSFHGHVVSNWVGGCLLKIKESVYLFMVVANNSSFIDVMCILPHSLYAGVNSFWRGIKTKFVIFQLRFPIINTPTLVPSTQVHIYLCMYMLSTTSFILVFNVYIHYAQ